MTPEEIRSKLDRILPSIQKPGRYTGGELNQIVKDWPFRIFIISVWPIWG